MNQANWQAQAQRGVDLLQSNQPVEALELLKQASQHAPQDRLLRYWIANGSRMPGDVQNSESIFQELLDATRAEHATRHLREGRLPVASIAYHLGFNDPSNFRRAYRRWTGTSPSKVRREARASQR